MDQSPPRVLVVDDDEAIRKFATRALSMDGYKVIVACDGPDAIQIVDGQPRFDLFILDLAMPGMSGDELGRRLLDRDPDSKVIYFTGYTERIYASRTALRYNEAVLEKPVTLGQFLDTVSQLLFGRAGGPAGRTPGSLD
jgi:two-component system, cell cycle sensor histidine kinase and response regulator CckA